MPGGGDAGAPRAGRRSGAEILLPFDTSPDPARSRMAWERICGAWPESLPGLNETVRAFADALPAVAHLLAVSPVSAEKIIRDPEALVWLSRPEVHAAERGPRRMRAELAALGWRRPDGTPRPADFAPLRRWKQREMLRIALRDVGRMAGIEETTRELTDLAEVCVREVVDAWLGDHVRRLGDPGSAFCVLGMGKFGGQELNFSSDIDVIFFHGEPGTLASGLSRQEFFARVAHGVVETFSATDAAGPLFRIDLRLRPEGDSGPLVRSLDGMENYYAAFGETWERMALGKARVVAGDEELGYEFFQRHQAFIYPRTVGAEMIGEVARIKARIEREIVGTANLDRNVKLGRGGIREIEFVCQSLQLLHGARHAFLQERQTLRALQGLRQLDLLAAAETDSLAAAYRFLRTVEHRLQIENEAQTHTLPADPRDMERLEASLGCGNLAAELARHTGAVRAIFERVVAAGVVTPEARIDRGFFRDTESARRKLADLGEGGGSAPVSPRTKRLFARLEPPLLGWLRKVADPDAALTRMVRFAERYGLRGALFETLLVNPRVLELLAKLFDASEFLSEIAIRRPELVEEVARTGNLSAGMTAAAHLARLAENHEGLPWEDRVRAYRRAQQLRIGLRDLLGLASLREVLAECSALAEACLVFVHWRLGLGSSLMVVALGKFGGRELGYGSDLDVLFIGDDPAGAPELIRAMTETTAEGRVFPMDARLRPEGAAGPLTVSLAEWDGYFSRGRGQLWEVQALTKARPVCGPGQAEWLDAARRIWREHAAAADMEERVAEMFARVSKHRGDDPLLDFKTGRGGLMKLEFFVQARQMRAGVWEPNTLAALAKVAPPEVAGRLAEAYLFLRKIENVLRRMEDTPVSKLPSDPVAQFQLAVRCGIGSREELVDRITASRREIADDARLP